MYLYRLEAHYYNSSEQFKLCFLTSYAYQKSLICRRLVYKSNDCFNILQFQYYPQSGFVVAVVHWERSTMEFRSLFQKFQKFKSDVMSKTSHELWLYQRNFVTFFYRLTFSPLTDPNYKITRMTWFCPAIYATTIVSTLYAIYIGRHEFISTMRDFYVSGVALTVRF